jgi:hypothetical protein
VQRGKPLAELCTRDCAAVVGVDRFKLRLDHRRREQRPARAMRGQVRRREEPGLGGAVTEAERDVETEYVSKQKNILQNKRKSKQKKSSYLSVTRNTMRRYRRTSSNSSVPFPSESNATKTASTVSLLFPPHIVESAAVSAVRATAAACCSAPAACAIVSKRNATARGATARFAGSSAPSVRMKVERATSGAPVAAAPVAAAKADIVKDVRGSESNCEQDSRKCNGI